MPGLIQAVSERFTTEWRRHHNKPFLTAAMAACAYVAAADGHVSLGERGRMDQFLDALARRKVFDQHEMVDLFDHFVDMLKSSPDAGRAAVFKALAKVAGDEEAGTIILHFCEVLARADAGDNAPEAARLDDLRRALRP